MERKIVLTFTISVIVGLVYFSCRKSSDCENCLAINQAPIANAGQDTIIVLPINSAVLNGSHSKDPDGIISDWFWKKISGPASFNISIPRTAMTTVNDLVSGTYQFELTVTDDEGKSSNDTVQVTVNAQTKTQLLTLARWKYTGAIISPPYDYYGDGVVVTNIFDIMKDCEKDDFELYKTDGTWEYNEGPTKCDPSYPQIFNLPWTLADNDTKLILGTDEVVILELTATKLRLRYTFEDAGINYTEEDSYEH